MIRIAINVRLSMITQHQPTFQSRNVIRVFLIIKSALRLLNVN